VEALNRIEEFLAGQILSVEGYSQYQTGNVGKSELARFVSELQSISRSYVGHTVGARLPSPIHCERAAEAYALYYTPINAAKVLHLLPLLSGLKREVSVLDVGSGPGTVGLALLAGLSRDFKMTCVEQSKYMRDLAERLISGFTGEGSLKTLTMVSELDNGGQKFDVVVAANLLAELSEEDAQELIDRIGDRVAEGGYLVIVEPGQQAHTRRLMSLRDRILATKAELVPRFPCLRRDSCPMLTASRTDWCHGAIEWRQPRLHAQLDDLLAFNKHRIKYAAFIFQRGGSLGAGVRVITQPERTRLGVEATICGDEIYGIVRVRKGQRSQGTRAFEKASAHDRLIFSEMKLGDIAVNIIVEVAGG
jgi:ribosomal protein RSM22 (predicted rRNA methylase)